MSFSMPSDTADREDRVTKEGQGGGAAMGMAWRAFRDEAGRASRLRQAAPGLVEAAV